MLATLPIIICSNIARSNQSRHENLFCRWKICLSKFIASSGTMGTIASVLQWQCNNCSTVNPIECVRCCGCDTVRLCEPSLEEDEDPQHSPHSDEGNTKEDCTEQSIEQHLHHQCQEQKKLPGTLSKGTGEPRDKTTSHQYQQQQSGYLEIRPDG